MNSVRLKASLLLLTALLSMGCDSKRKGGSSVDQASRPAESSSSLISTCQAAAENAPNEPSKEQARKVWEKCSKLLRQEQCASAVVGSPDELMSLHKIVRVCAAVYCAKISASEGLVACTSDDPMPPQVLGEAWAQLLAEIIVLDHGEEQKTLVGQALHSAFEVQRRVPPPTPPTARRVEDENAITINIGATSFSIDAGNGKDKAAGSLEQLPAALPGGSKERTVVLVAEPGVSNGRLIEVLNVLKREGYQHIQFGSSQ